MNRINAELSSIVPFKEDGFWYLKLVYKYEDEKGNKHTAIIPKAVIPFQQRGLPYINRLQPYSQTGSKITRSLSELPYINCSDSMPLHDSICDLAIERGIKEPGCCFDIITEYASREMTLDEIEKELGYKVKIINKESDNRPII